MQIRALYHGKQFFIKAGWCSVQLVLVIT